MIRSCVKALAITLLTVLPAWADELATPEGDVILTISGNIDVSNVNLSAQLDIEMLENFKATTIETSTIWTEGKQTFQGVSLDVLVKELGITGTTLKATAINNYTVEIPMSDAVEGGAIVAYRLNGKNMSIRQKGPLWIIYPYDDNADYRTEVIYSRSIWQLDRIEALN